MAQRTVDAVVVARTLRELAAALSRDSAGLGLSRTAAGTLSALDRHGPLRVADLVRLETVRQPAMTGLLQRLEAAGLVTRATDPGDRRSTIATLTDAGRAALEERRTHQDALIEARLSRLSPERLHALESAHPALVDLIQEDHDQPR